jgi:hypothetical protein
VEAGAGAAFTDQAERRPLRDIDGARRIAVHGGRIEWRLAAQGGQWPRQGAPMRLDEWHQLTLERLSRGGEDDVERRLDR